MIKRISREWLKGLVWCLTAEIQRGGREKCEGKATAGPAAQVASMPGTHMQQVVQLCVPI